jgi:acyl-CoA dehydrogenase
VHDASDDLRRSLQSQARDAGLLAPHVPQEWGGCGLDVRGQAVVFEAAGYSLLGPLALNCAAPDEGNMHLLERVADEEQKAQYLRPLAAGEIRSCFAMTEPAPGAGSDPAMLATTATKTDGGWRIDGRKWFISGARGAAFAICMARTSGSPGDRGGATMFLVDADNPGMQIIRDLDTLDEGLFGGHSEVAFDGCVVGPESVLGEVDKGFQYAQVRLAPARLTHCMRWLGVAIRAHDIAVDWAATRKSFGGILGDLGMVQQMIADSEIDIAASRALIRDTAAVLDSGGRGNTESSIAKTFVAEAVNRVVDRSVQICGALGISGDVLLSRYLREIRPFRIYDGPSEVHRMVLARELLREGPSP